MKRVITYGTYDLLHYGHIALLRRARALGDFLVVALSSDEFNAGKGKRAYFSYEERKVMLEAIRYVDLVVPELTWGQKTEDISRYGIDVFVMGDDWSGESSTFLGLPRFLRLRSRMTCVCTEWRCLDSGRYADRNGGLEWKPV